MYRYYVSLSMTVHKESKHDFLKYDNKSTDCNMCMMKLFKEILWEKQRKTGIVKNKGLERRSQWVTLLQWLILPIHISSPVVLYQDHSMRTPVFTLCVGCSLIWQTLFLKLLEDPLFKKKKLYIPMYKCKLHEHTKRIWIWQIANTDFRRNFYHRFFLILCIQFRFCFDFIGHGWPHRSRFE